MEIFYFIFIFIGGIGLCYWYGQIQLKLGIDAGIKEGYKFGYNEGQIKGSEQSLLLLEELKLINIKELADNISSGKYNDNPKIRKGYEALKQKGLIY